MALLTINPAETPTVPSDEHLMEVDKFVEHNYEFRCNPKYQSFIGCIKGYFRSRAIKANELERTRERYLPEDVVRWSGPLSDEAKEKELERHRKFELENSFGTALMKLIDAKGQDYVEVYKRANIDRKLFSKIRSQTNYLPSKRTIISLALALELSLDETNALLKKAGFVLSRSILFDTIIEYYITHEMYNIHEINGTLFAYNETLLNH